jgi:acyl-CoA thioester hydrolase
MYVNETIIRVRYAETDQMGYVYYGNYATYFEIGRVEWLRELGLTYKSMEEGGVMMPVLECHMKYIRPARYDEALMVKTFVPELPGTRMKFMHEIHNERDELIHKGETTLVFVNMNTGKPIQAPEYLTAKVKSAIHNA